MRLKLSSSTGHLIVKACIVAILLVGTISSILPQTVKLFSTGLYSNPTEATVPNRNELSASEWILENTSPSTILLSDPVSMDIISSLSERISLAEFSMGQPVRTPQDTTRVDLVLQLFEASTSLDIYDKISQLSKLGVSGDEFYRSFEPLDDSSFLIFLSSRTVEWVNSGGERTVSYLEEKPVPDDFVSKFSNPDLFNLVFSIDEFLYVFEPRYSSMLSAAEHLGDTGYVADERLIFDMPLDEGDGYVTYDQSITGSLGNVTEPNWIIDNENESELNFDGNATYVSVPHSDYLNSFDEFSISVWVKPTNVTVSKEQTILFKPNQYLLRIDSPSEGGSFSFFVRDEKTWEPRAKSGVVPEANNWYHLVGVYDQEELKLYVNGVLMKSVSRVEPINFTNESMLIGRPCYFNGIIKDVQIYGAALDDFDVQNLFMRTTKGYSVIYFGASYDPGVLFSSSLTFQSVSAEVYMQAYISESTFEGTQPEDEELFAFQVYDEQTDSLIYEQILVNTDIQNSTNSDVIFLATLNNLSPNTVYNLRLIVLTNNYDVFLRNLLIKELVA